MKEKSDVVRGSRLVVRGGGRAGARPSRNEWDARCDSEDEADLTPPEVAVPDWLDFLAAVLPEEEKVRMGLPVETEPTEKTESAAAADEDTAAIAAN